MKKFAPRKLRRSDVIISRMPFLPHTQESQGHRLESSAALQWICDELLCDPPDANREFQRAAGIGAIAYSPMRSCWYGTGFVYRKIADEFVKQEEATNEPG